jgi:chromate transporter
MENPSFKQALRFWLKLGFISFGGPAGQISIMYAYVVEKKKWISESKFLHALNYCMLLPGPEAQQLATYIGWMLHGTWGGLVAGSLFVLPSMLILLGLSIAYVSFGSLPWVYALFNGLKPAVIAIIVLALIKIGKKSLLSPFHYMVALASFAGIFFFNASFPLLILCAIALALVAGRFFPFLLKEHTDSKNRSEDDESGYCINKYTIVPHARFSTSRFIKQVVFAALLWIIPLFICYLLCDQFQFWKKLAFFFTKAALVTFGGAYAVLPYVAQVSVDDFRWLTKLQMMDGMALGETTPGPLIMVLTFVGFMGGFNHYHGSIAMGTAGLLMTTFYTFLPGFFFIFAGAPLIEQSGGNKRIKQLLSIVTAAVVGVILNLSIYLGKAVLFPGAFTITAIDYTALIWTGVSLFVLYRLQWNMIRWIAVSAVFGLVQYYFLHGKPLF